MPDRKPRLLVGSSTEGLTYAHELQTQLQADVETLLWNQGLFTPGEYAIDSLDLQSRRFDGAVVVATADDRVISRGSESPAPRDNLLFEWGMFVAVFGRRRALLMVEQVGETKLPSDAAGLTVVPFEVTDPIAIGVGPAANQIRDAALTWRDAPFDPELVRRLERVLQVALSEIQDRAGVASELGIHVFLLDERSTPSSLVRVARARTSPKSPRLWPPFEEGVGVVGTCWSTASTVLADFTDAFFAAADEATWSSLGPLQQLGMDFDMLQESLKRYKCVGAVPISTTVDGFIGCLSFNLGVSASADVTQLQTREVERVLDISTEMIAIVVGH
jgi:hypothetical protein